MSAETRITATEYDPDDDLRALLDEVLRDATVSYGEEQDLSLSAGIEGFQRDYEVSFGEFEPSGFETITSLGVFVSLEGHLGLAASVVLSHALRYGVPTVLHRRSAACDALRRPISGPHCRMVSTAGGSHGIPGIASRKAHRRVRP